MGLSHFVNNEKGLNSYLRKLKLKQLKQCQMEDQKQ